MSLYNSTQSGESGQNNHQDIVTSFENTFADVDVNMENEDEDEEEEDVDFNPFLRGESPSEASSSLSSENEGPGDSVKKGFRSFSDCQETSSPPRQTDEVQCCSKDSENEEGGIVLQTGLSMGETHEGDDVLVKGKKVELQSSVQHIERLTCLEGTGKESCCVDASHAADDLAKNDFLAKPISSPSSKISQKPITEAGDEDAICRRTRARHSLANYTLEELETFLQESDDDGDLQNVDDEEEYRKFLAAVLLDGADNGQSGQVDENFDEDEENDADFEIEIEEALESDVDDVASNNQGQNDMQGGDFHRPETRQKKHLKEPAKNRKSLIGQAKLPLRPILPYSQNAQVAPFHSLGWQFSSAKGFAHCTSLLSDGDLINGFTAHQVGQLYCLIHEHIQLLIQIFSVCVLDPSKQQVATEVQKMIFEMVDRREEALAQRTISYPVCCFDPAHLHSSPSFDMDQTVKFSCWTPLIDKPIQSVLDVAPLSLLKGYMTDVSATVSKYRQRQVESTTDKSYLKREPLFLSPSFASLGETNTEALEQTTTKLLNTPLPGQIQAKKSLAATLVEDTKKRPVALVPVDIAKLAQRFHPLFNSAIFPHKPPVPAVANRVLFTDAEDRLLAMGIMEYNNDWAAIQQRFLPCKSKHQIFVRQKNRSSSKAPENPIKVVRRMKTAPLNADEIAHVYEGLKIFKQDWLLVWKFCVPHRDPSLLPRQWRVAIGTQKSYRSSEAGKEKRRLYEAKRRKLKASMTDKQSSSRKEVDNGEDNCADDKDDQDEAYVHEAFLSDSLHGCSKQKLSDISLSSLGISKLPSVDMMPDEDAHISENSAAVSDECGESLQKNGGLHEFVTSINSLEDVPHLSRFSHTRYSAAPYSASSKQPPSNLIARPSSIQSGLLPYRTRRTNHVKVVKLAPNLPPVNLPRSVRVISRSSFTSHPSGSSYSRICGKATRSFDPQNPQVTRGSGIKHHAECKNVLSDNSAELRCPPNGNTSAAHHACEGKTSDSDLHMHPLLFQTPKDQFTSYYVMNCNTTTASIYNFFPGNPTHHEYDFLDPRHPLRKIDRSKTTVQTKEAPTNLHTIEFHPLLQQTDNVNGDSAIVSSIDRPFGDSEMQQGNYPQFLGQPECTLKKSVDKDVHLPTGGASPSHYEKENELDLDIRLFSASGKEKIFGSRNVGKQQIGEPTISTSEHSMVGKGKHIEIQFYDHRNKCLEAMVSSNSCYHSRSSKDKHVDSSEVGPSSNGGVCQCREDGLSDEPIPDIVMEQEELSDSDEESEHVEFECEEIDDSEGEGVGDRHPTEMHNKIEHLAAVDEIQADLDLNQPQQSKSQPQRSIKKVKYNASHTNLFPDSPSDRPSRIKPKRERMKKSHSCGSSLNEVHSRPGRSSRTLVGESSKISRKSRKRSRAN